MRFLLAKRRLWRQHFRIMAASWMDPQWWANAPAEPRLHEALIDSHNAAQRMQWRNGNGSSQGRIISRRSSSPRQIKPPLPDEARSPAPSPRQHMPRPASPYTRPDSPPPSARSWHSVNNASVMAGEVRPQWTPRTSAGRAKLHVDDVNWEHAERLRQLREHREKYKAEFRNHIQLTNTYEAAVKREERLEALQSARQAVKQQTVEQGRQTKAEGEQLRELARQQRQNWEEYGKYLTRYHTNAGARAARRQVEFGKADEAERQRRQRESHRHERAHELSEHIVANREKAQRARRESSLALRSVSDAELRSRHEVAQLMRRAEMHRDGQRLVEKREMLEIARQSHDAVLEHSAREKVRGYLEADRRKNIAPAAEQRARLHRMRFAIRNETNEDFARKKEMHDAVKHAEIYGYTHPVDAIGRPLSPNVRWLSLIHI